MRHIGVTRAPSRLSSEPLADLAPRRLFVTGAYSTFPVNVSVNDNICPGLSS